MYLAARILFPSSVLETSDRIKASVIPEEMGINPEHITRICFIECSTNSLQLFSGRDCEAG
jgi:hypothetical protein